MCVNNLPRVALDSGAAVVGVRVICDVGYLCAILVILGLSVLDLGQIYATDRQTDVRRQTRIIA